MYAYRAMFSTERNKMADLKGLLVERAVELKAQAIPVSLSMVRFGTEAGAFHFAFRFDSLSSFEAFLRKPDPSRGSFFSRLEPLVQRRQEELYEVIMPAARPAEPPAILHRIEIIPLPGKGGQLKEQVLELGRWRQSEGFSAGVQVQAAGPASGTYVLTCTFANSSEFEKLLIIEETAARNFNDSLAGLAARFPDISLGHILVPFTADV